MTDTSAFDRLRAERYERERPLIIAAEEIDRAG
jgi:hypothetical protein